MLEQIKFFIKIVLNNMKYYHETKCAISELYHKNIYIYTTCFEIWIAGAFTVYYFGDVVTFIEKFT